MITFVTLLWVRTEGVSLMEINLDLLNGFTEIIANVGFPIFISMFLLNRMEMKLDHIVDALTLLTEVIADDQ